MSAMRQALVYQGESGQWVAEVPSLPGCASQGKTLEEAIEYVREAIELHIEALKAHRRPVPPERFDAKLIAV
jgi:predicted RNase H-like HicB family nuclease